MEMSGNLNNNVKQAHSKEETKQLTEKELEHVNGGIWINENAIKSESYNDNEKNMRDPYFPGLSTR